MIVSVQGVEMTISPLAGKVRELNLT